jgi:hypothetical protein
MLSSPVTNLSLLPAKKNGRPQVCDEQDWEYEFGGFPTSVVPDQEAYKLPVESA